MVALSKLKIFKVDDPGTSFEVKINPESFKLNRKVRYAKDQTLGTSADVCRFDGHAPTSLSFNFMLDSTGIAYEKKETIQATVKKMEKVVYNLNGKIHRPNPLTVTWGNFKFNCLLESLDYDYSLFAPDGEPLRVKISVSFTNYETRSDEIKKKNTNSPDLTHIVVLKAGESIPSWCNKIYGDASYCVEVARHNGLSSFKNVNPGTRLMFPPLVRKNE